MNPYVSVNWFEIVFPVALVLIVGGLFLLNRPRRADLLYTVGSLALILALAGATAANLLYQRALYASTWPTTGMFDQIVVTPVGDVFVKLRDPIMGRANRVQRYSCRGEFKAAYQPDSAGGLFKFAVDRNSTLSIYSVRTNTIDSFSFGGTFLRRREVDSHKMPFDFLKPGPSVTRAGSCEFTIDPVSGQPAVRNSAEVSPLERGDRVLEYVLNRQNMIGVALFGALLLLVSLIRERWKIQAGTG